MDISAIKKFGTGWPDTVKNKLNRKWLIIKEKKKNFVLLINLCEYKQMVVMVASVDDAGVGGGDCGFVSMQQRNLTQEELTH